jgi:glycosyltransferase involved in cell wall biosynthesis
MVPALLELAGEHQVFLYADGKAPFELTKVPGNVSVRYLPWKGPLWSIRNDLLMRNSMAQDELDVAHFPANYGFAPRSAKAVITLHDELNLLPLHQLLLGRGSVRTARTVAMTCYLSLCTRAAVRRASAILTVSEHAAREIARHCPLDPNQIVPIHHGPAPDLQRVDDEVFLAEVRRTHALPERFVLADALKNPGVLVHAWGLLPAGLREGRRIVFFSRRPDPLPVVGQAVARGDALLLVRPSRADLIALYSMADVFVFPSWVEGFGIPLLEAMSCGAPVIASDRGAIPEVVSDAALLMDAEDAHALAAHLVSVLSHPAEADRLRASGFARSRQFSWRRNAQRALEVFERVGRATQQHEPQQHRNWRGLIPS